MTAPSPGQWVVRLLVAVMPVLALLCTVGAGEGPPVWLVGLVAVLAIAFAAFPESAVGVAVLVLVLAWWGLGLRDGLDPWAVPAAAAILTAHLAALLAAYGPDRLRLDPDLVWLWVRRGLSVLVVSPVLLAVVLELRDSPEPTGIWVLGLAAAFAAITAASFAYRPGRPDA